MCRLPYEIRKLKKIIKKDFKKDQSKVYKSFENELINEIRNCESLEGLKVETMERLAKHKNAQLISRFALVMSFAGMSISAIMGLSEVDENFQVILSCIAILLSIMLGFSVLKAISDNVKNNRYISYCEIKLYCIKKIEKEQQEQINDWRKVKYEIRLKEK